MTELASLAGLGGFAAAHGVWCVAEGETLVPFWMGEQRDGKRALTRFVTDKAEDGVAQARALLGRAGPEVSRGVIVYDGYITLDWGKTDALIVEARSFVAHASYTNALPYRHARSGFAVFKPKLLALEPIAAQHEFGAAFFTGVDAHTKGAAVWNAHIDQSR